MENELYKYEALVIYSDRKTQETITFESEHENWPIEVLAQKGSGMIKIPYQHVWISHYDIEKIERV